MLLHNNYYRTHQPTWISIIRRGVALSIWHNNRISGYTQSCTWVMLQLYTCLYNLNCLLSIATAKVWTTYSMVVSFKLRFEAKPSGVPPSISCCWWPVIVNMIGWDTGLQLQVKWAVGYPEHGDKHYYISHHMNLLKSSAAQLHTLVHRSFFEYIAWFWQSASSISSSVKWSPVALVSRTWVLFYNNRYCCSE